MPTEYGDLLLLLRYHSVWNRVIHEWPENTIKGKVNEDVFSRQYFLGIG